MMLLAAALASILTLRPCRHAGRERPALQRSTYDDFFSWGLRVGDDAYDSRSVGECAVAGRTAKSVAYGPVLFRHHFYAAGDPDLVLVAQRIRDGQYVSAAKILSNDGLVARIDTHWPLSAAALAKASQGDFAGAERLLAPDAVAYIASPEAYFGADGNAVDQTITLTPLTLALVTCARGEGPATERLLYAVVREFSHRAFPDLGPFHPPPVAFSAALYLIGELTRAGSQPLTCRPQRRG